MTPEQLKASILQYAIQGKLVEQREEEGTAEELYKQIQDEKAKLVKEGKIKKEKSLDDITEDEIPYDIPGNWKWVRFGEFGSYKKGPFGSALTKSIFVPKGNNTVKVYEQKNAIQKDATLGDYYITKEYFDSNMRGFEVHSGDVIVSCAGTIGEAYILPENIEKGIINQALMRMTLMPSVYKPYFLMFFDVVLKKNAIKSSKGSAIKNIPPFDELKSYLVPLPPLEEQYRIVSKIEELLSLVDQYAEAYEKLEKFNAGFPEDIKKSILQYAIQGKLVEQREEEGTAEELYRQIQEEKQKLIKEGKIKKEKPLEDLTDDEIPFDIPDSWKWVRLGHCGCFERGSGIKKDEVIPEGKPCVRYGQLYTTYKTRFNKAVSFISQELFEKCHKVQNGDILMALTGENEYDIALAVTYEGSEDVAMGGDMTRFFNHCMNPLYLTYVINSRYGILCKSKMASGNIIVHISNDKLATIPIPLPPLEEQNRIVAKIEELLPYCERLAK